MFGSCLLFASESRKRLAHEEFHGRDFMFLKRRLLNKQNDKSNAKVVAFLFGCFLDFHFLYYPFKKFIFLFKGPMVPLCFAFSDILTLC